MITTDKRLMMLTLKDYDAVIEYWDARQTMLRDKIFPFVWPIAGKSLRQMSLVSPKNVHSETARCLES